MSQEPAATCGKRIPPRPADDLPGRAGSGSLLVLLGLDGTPAFAPFPDSAGVVADVGVPERAEQADRLRPQGSREAAAVGDDLSRWIRQDLLRPP